ncbi:MAG: hypothetical protein JKY53_05435 [Flavobacteriales bacterium]|nr:hypothetical protein [Flavobacteriales bacterium]
MALLENNNCFFKKNINPELIDKNDVRKMYQIIVEMHSGLRDKSQNEGLTQLNLYETIWLQAMDNLLSKYNLIKENQ